MHYLLHYEKVPDYATRQVPYMPAHHEYLARAFPGCEILVAGSLEDPVDGAAVLFLRADSKEAVEALAKDDPFVTEGIVCKWSVRGWDTVLGSALPLLANAPAA